LAGASLAGTTTAAGCLRVHGGRTYVSVAPAPDAKPVATPDLGELLARMTLEEKIGQMTQADLRGLRNPSDVATYHLGSILNGGDSIPTPNEPGTWADTYDGLQGHAMSTRLGVPMIYGVDAVHGHNGVRGAVIFPHNIGLGATHNAALIEEVSRITALEVAGTGMDWTFAPCVAVPQDERWGRTYEGFGETAALVSELGAAAVKGYQGATLADGATVLACAKHYVADGGTSGGKDQGDARIDEAELRAVHLAPYRAAIEAGVGSIMASYSSWNGDKLHGHKYLLTDVLKGELGFEGFVVSDWQAISKMPHGYAGNIARAINAGIDMAMVPNGYVQFMSTLKQLVEKGHVPMSRIDDAVMRILRQKAALDLWQKPTTDRALTEKIGCAAHRKVARQAVRESLVVLKNKAALPLKKSGHIHVMGPYADDLGAQCGGWTVSWKGKLGRHTEGTTILEGLRAEAGDAKVTFDSDSADAKADVLVVVVGEEPYVEYYGDRQNLALSKRDQGLIRQAAEAGPPVVVVLLSGRPLILGEALESCDAFVAAWLPGSEGQGVADVLYGDHKPSGKLPHTWPRSMSQIPLNVRPGSSEVAGDDALFAFGHGLTF